MARNTCQGTDREHEKGQGLAAPPTLPRTTHLIILFLKVDRWVRDVQRLLAGNVVEKVHHCRVVVAVEQLNVVLED
jgi:hypothetical protein